MISKSTKKKHRRNKERITAREGVTTDLIDRRCDFWLISHKTSRLAFGTLRLLQSNHYTHIEARGKKKALKILRATVSSI